MLVNNNQLARNDFLIIDEPEVNLHPEWQVRLAELLVLLVHDLNVTVYVNSHSPHFIEAIEVLSVKYGLRDETRFYMTSFVEEFNKYDFVKLDYSNLRELYRNLGNPYNEINKIRLENDLKGLFWKDCEEDIYFWRFIMLSDLMQYLWDNYSFTVTELSQTGGHNRNCESKGGHKFIESDFKMIDMDFISCKFPGKRLSTADGLYFKEKDKFIHRRWIVFQRERWFFPFLLSWIQKDEVWWFKQCGYFAIPFKECKGSLWKKFQLLFGWQGPGFTGDKAEWHHQINS